MNTQAEKRKEVGIGLVEVYPGRGCIVIKPEKGAVTHVVACVADANEFKDRVTELCDFYHLQVFSIEDAAPVRCGEKRVTSAEEIARLIREVSGTDQVRFSTFHVFPISEGRWLG